MTKKIKMTKIIPNNRIEKSRHLFEFAYDKRMVNNVKTLNKLFKTLSAFTEFGEVELRMNGRHPDRKMLSEKYGIKNSSESIPIKYAKTAVVYAFTRPEETNGFPSHLLPGHASGDMIIKLIKVLEKAK
jgi:hypothetical protein